MDLGLDRKRAIITGGSHGLGREIAQALAAEGVSVTICGRHQDTLDAAADRIRSATGGNVLAVVADVARPAELENLVARSVQHFGGVDILINNADSAVRKADFFELTDADWQEVFDIKLFSAIRLVRLAAPHMVSAGWGRIISMSGATSRLMMPYGMPKGAAHAGLINLTKKLAVLLGPQGITVNAFEPGHMWTDGPTVGNRSRYDIRREEVQRAADEAEVSYAAMDRRLQAKLVIGRRIDPADSAQIVTFLASKQAATITGEVIVGDGGESGYVRY